MLLGFLLILLGAASVIAMLTSEERRECLKLVRTLWRFAQMHHIRYYAGLPLLFLGLGLIFVSVIISGDPFDDGNKVND